MNKKYLYSFTFCSILASSFVAVAMDEPTYVRILTEDHRLGQLNVRTMSPSDFKRMLSIVQRNTQHASAGLVQQFNQEALQRVTAMSQSTAQANPEVTFVKHLSNLASQQQLNFRAKNQTDFQEIVTTVTTHRTVASQALLNQIEQESLRRAAAFEQPAQSHTQVTPQVRYIQRLNLLASQRKLNLQQESPHNFETLASRVYKHKPHASKELVRQVERESLRRAQTFAHTTQSHQHVSTIPSTHPAPQPHYIGQGSSSGSSSQTSGQKLSQWWPAQHKAAFVLPYYTNRRNGNKYYLVGHETAGSDAGTFSAFGGKADSGEGHPFLSAGREFFEEANLHRLGWSKKDTQNYVDLKNGHTKHITAHTAHNNRLAIYITELSHQDAHNLLNRFNYRTNRDREMDQLAEVREDRLIAALTHHRNTVEGTVWVNGSSQGNRTIKLRPFMAKLRHFFGGNMGTPGADRRIHFYN